ncbi:MAG TPA: hypothetical protein VEB64_11210, partial [Azospirillaceae bacterium]|nr:hypothetical protein [Azospirillaceae bacterium]
MTAPTGTLGVGWTIAEDRIVVQMSDTATTKGDSYFLISGGTLPLFRTGPTTIRGEQAIGFLVQSQPFWFLAYFPGASADASRWELVREDGNTYIYGGIGTAIDWRLAWGNWIGPTVDRQARRIAAGWRLTAIRDAFGNTIRFEYESDELPIGGPDGPRFTRSIHTSRIVDPLGRQAVFVYNPKDDREIQLPHVQSGTVQAFQYSYETKYLDSIHVLNENGEQVFTTHLAYQLVNASSRPGKDAYLKRYLSGIRQEYAGGASPAGFDFEYADPASTNPGALTRITYPKGGTAEYSYTALKLNGATTRAVIDAPSSDCRPSLWQGPDYTVVVWYNSTTSTAQFTVQSWYGDWRSWAASASIGPFAIEDLRIITGSGMFAAVYTDTARKRQRVQLFHSNPYRTGECLPPTELQLDANATDIQVAVGSDYVAVASAKTQAIKIAQWDMKNQGWAVSSISAPSSNRVVLASGLQCLLAAFEDASHQVKFQIYYRNESGNWTVGDSRTASIAIDWEHTNPQGVWSVGGTFATATFVTGVTSSAVDAVVTLLQWRSDYSLSTFNQWPSHQPPTLQNPIGYSVVTGSQVGHAQDCYRF